MRSMHAAALLSPPALAAANRVTAGQRCDTAAVLLVSFATVWAPLAFGAAITPARLMLQCTAAAAVLLWCIGSRPSAWLMLLPFLIACLLSCQLVRLPDSMLMAIAPVSAGVWKVARDGSANAWNTISIDPAATSNSIRSAFLSAAVMCALIALGQIGRAHV